MAKDPNYGKIDTQFESFHAGPAPAPSENPGGQHNPGVQAALNTPPTEGRIKTSWYYSPTGPAPRIENTTVNERIDSTFEDTMRQTIAYKWNPGDSPRPQGSGAMESAMNNPLDMSLPPAQVNVYAPTPPGDSMGAGGGQGPGEGATPPGNPMSYGGGQSS